MFLQKNQTFAYITYYLISDKNKYGMADYFTAKQ